MRDRGPVATIGESIVFKGELSGDEELEIEGRVEGKIDLHQSVLKVGERGKVNGKIAAKTVVVAGDVRGDIRATEVVAMRNTSSFEGEVRTPRLAIESGAYLRGNIDMGQSRNGKPAATSAAEGAADVPN